MMKLILSILTVVMFGFGAGIAGAADPMSDKEATPRLGERFTKDTIKGTLMKMDGDYSSIKDTEGKQSKIHVDTGTTLDKVVVGDKVNAYITDWGHATTLQRDE